MQIEKTKTIVVTDFKHSWSGQLSTLNSKHNPYYSIASKIAKKNNIPERVVENSNISINGDTATFHFRWYEEAESPEKDKHLILGYIGKLPTSKKDFNYFPAYIKINDNYYKTYIYDYDEFINDYKTNEDTVEIVNEISFIDSLNIDFKQIYSESLFNLFNDYNLNPTIEKVYEFLENDEVKKFIIEENAESLSDTAPREELIGLYQDIIEQEIY